VPVIHFLNVKQGDCSVIQHASDRVSVIDVCNAKEPADRAFEKQMREAAAMGILGNFNQKKHPVNPITYLQDHGIASVFRFILTHPDMDHMDGIKLFFETFGPLNLWDTDNEEEKDFEEGSPYDEEDWLFYKKLHDEKPDTNPKRLTLLSGARGPYYNQAEVGQAGGDGLHILAPNANLVQGANECGDYNDCSYVVLYLAAGGRRIVFGGDSHDATWEHIIEAHEADVKDVDLLIAPHHGRKSDRCYDFLDVLKPKLTFFGNASCEDLAYGAWDSRNLPFVTNNQAGCMVVDIGKTMDLYVTHKPFAEKINPDTFYSSTLQAYYCCPFA
jgi:competence protein ComEC